MLFDESVSGVFKNNFELFKAYFNYQIQHPSWDNPYYIIPTICLIAFALELTLPRKLSYHPIKRKGFLLDLFYVIFFDYLILLFGFYAFTETFEYFFKRLLLSFGIENYIITDLKRIPFLLQFVTVFILLDFLQWLGHYLLHRINFLWQFHKIHHAQQELGFASTRHFHWVEYFVFKPLLYLPFMMLNFSVNEFIAYYLWIGYGFTFFSHCNVKVNWKWLNYSLITPETHFWHHAKNIPAGKSFGINFASTTTLWDHLFGFFYLPEDDKQPLLGVEDQRKIPNTFIGQMIYPFKAVLSKNDKVNLSKAKKRQKQT
ncbi:MAG: sterol desaturase family protein [Flavobacteriales bacterium]